MLDLQRLKLFLPFLFLLALFGLLGRELFYATPNEPPSVLIGEAVPHFQLPSLFSPSISLTPKIFHGQVSLLNVWASWCYACQVEAPMLMKIKDQYHIPVYGIAYKDKAEDAKQWLQAHGNPYALIGSDLKGDVAIDLGVYGTPETFVIDRQGKIIYRHIGVLDQKAWDDVLHPLIQQLQKEKL
jgi:cytochrome c biogenesis protein CcmG/thiol:disulfide interchange protein DsbE